MATSEQAQAVLNNPAFNQSFGQLREELVDKMLVAGDKDEIWETKCRIDSLELVKLELERLLNQIAER